MNKERADSSSSRVKWTALIVLTAINLLNYIDRYIFSALAPAMQKDLGFSDTQIGLLGSAFIIAYTVAAPIYGWLGDVGARSRVMACGVFLWSIATSFSGLARSFFGQFVTRVVVGVGESAYSVIAPSTIGDHFEKTSRGRVFAVYSGALPVGSALGYVLGEQLEKLFGWEKAFFVVGIPGLACALLLWFMHDPKRGQAEQNDVASDVPAALPLEARTRFIDGCKGLMKNGGFIAAVLGYAAYTFVVGGMAFWMPTYITRYFAVENGITIFGALTVVGGFLGTLIGGWWADRIEKRTGNGFLKVSVVSAVLSVPLLALVLKVDQFPVFVIVLLILEIALFLCISPLDAVVIGYVRPAIRSTAMAVNVFLIHLLGDGISRTLIGSMSDSSDLRSAIAFCPWVLALAGVIWLIGLVCYWQPLAWPEKGARPPRLQAHRGLWKSTALQENSLDAFRAAGERGVEMIELDVVLAGDGQAVVFHDRDLKRMAGVETLVANSSAAEMKALANAPRLEEVLLDTKVPRLINVELKSSEVRSDGLEREVARVIRTTGTENRILFSSFNPFVLHRLSHLLPNVPRALLVTEEASKPNRIWFRKMWLGFWARPHLLHLHDKMITRERLESWSERGIPVIAWTVNDSKKAKELLAWGARGVISDEIVF